MRDLRIASTLADDGRPHALKVTSMADSGLYGDVSDHPTLMVGSMIIGSAMHDSEQQFQRHKQEIQALWPLMKWQGYKTRGYHRCLDVGGGHGVHTPWLLQMTDELIVSDTINYNSLYDGRFLTALLAEIRSNHEDIDLSRVEFHRADAQDLVYKDDIFDLIISINAFEHIPEPSLALSELVRVGAPGAVVYVQFDPLWHSPYGHHLWHLGLEPWSHLVTNSDAFREVIIKAGGSQADIDVYENDMNRKSFEYFREAFDDVCKIDFKKSYINYWAKNDSEEPAVVHPNFKKCLDLGYSEEDLMVRGFQFIGELG